MIESTFRADKFAFSAFKDNSTIDAILPEMNGMVFLRFGVLTLDFFRWLVYFHFLS